MNQTEYSNANTPASKADACASCDLPFDESDIAPALRKENFKVDTLDSHRERKDWESSPWNCTSLETVDIGIDEVPPQKSEPETIEPTVEENRN